MSLFDSVSRTIKGLLNDAADSVQDPSRDARQIVLDDSIGRAENSLIEIEAGRDPAQQARCGRRQGEEVRGRREARAAVR